MECDDWIVKYSGICALADIVFHSSVHSPADRRSISMLTPILMTNEETAGQIDNEFVLVSHGNPIHHLPGVLQLLTEYANESRKASLQRTQADDAWRVHDVAMRVCIQLMHKIPHQNPYRKFLCSRIKDYRNLSFSEADLFAADFSDARFEFCDFRKANLSNADFSGANCRLAHFEASRLDNCSFQSSPGMTAEFLSSLSIRTGK